MKQRRFRPLLMSSAVLAAASLALVGCTASNDAETPPVDAPAADGSVAEIRDMLPQRFLDSGVINVGTSPNSPPSSQPDGDKTIGIIPDLAAEVSKVLGVELKITAMDYAGLIPALQSARIDANWSVINDTVERQETMDMVDFMRSDHGFLVLKGNPKNITSADALCGTKAGTVKGGLDQEFLEEQQIKCEAAGNPMEVLLYNSRQDIQTAMLAGNVDSFLGIMTSHAFQAKAVQNGEVFEVAPGSYISGYQAIAILKENHELAKALQAALKHLATEGTYLDVLTKHDVPDAALEVSEIMINGVGNGLA